MTEDAIEDPYGDAGFLSRISLWWITDVLRRALKRSLTPKDVVVSLPWGKTHVQINSISKKWPKTRMCSSTKKPASFPKALFSHVWKKMLLSLILAFIGEALKFTMPVYTALLVDHFNTLGDNNLLKAHAVGIGLVLTTTAYGYFQINYSYMNQIIAMQLRTTCSGLIYRKLLRMNTALKGAPSSGHINTLLSADVERFAKAVATIQSLFLVPIILVAFILWESLEMGLSILSGIGIIIIFQLVRTSMSKLQSRAWKSALSWTDRRIQHLTEMITSMRTIKMYCWEERFAQKAKYLRKQENSKQRLNIFLSAFGSSLNHSVGNVVIFVMAITYIYMGYDLKPTIAIKLIGWVHIMENMVFINLPTSVGSLLETMVSVNRIEKFLNSDELPEKVISPDNSRDEICVNLKDVWASHQNGELGDGDNYALENLTLHFKAGELIAVIGPVGAGKTSLLDVCLGELPLMSGQKIISGSTALVPQEAWLIPTSLQSNILLGSDLDEQRYQEAIDVCQLQPDLDDLPQGDQTLVGERGQKLSGGQKARVNLARAVYNNADIVFFDDPLSAVDPNVGKDIFGKCICGTLKGKLRILVTHHLEHLSKADRIVLMAKGRVQAVGTYEELSDQLDLSEFVNESMAELASTPPNERGNAEENELDKLFISWDRRQRELMTGPAQKKVKMKNGGKTGDKQLLLPSDKLPSEHKVGKWSEKEKNCQGVVSFHVYVEYFRSGYGIILLPLLFFLLAAVVGSEIVAEWWMSEWYTHGYNPGLDMANITTAITNGTINKERGWTGNWSVFVLSTETRVAVLSALVVFHIVMNVFQATVLAFVCVSASSQIYCSMFERIIRAPMSFFESNSTGGIINRFARDTGFMDDRIPWILSIAFPSIVTIIGFVIYISIICPWAILCVVLVASTVPAVYYFTMSGMRDLKRIEAGYRSTTFSHLNASIQGLPVVRAFNLEEKFIQESDDRMDQHAMAWFMYTTSERFFSVFLNNLVSLALLLLIIIMLNLPYYDRRSGSKGLAISYTIFAIAYVRLSSLKVASLETYMTSVERILQFSRVEQEAPQHTHIHPPLGWPTHGEISFSNVCLQYKSSGRIVLGPLSVHIQPREKVAIVGRTGAGKTSVFSSLMRITEPVGSIRIDGLEIKLLGLDDLRNGILAIPQDPLLFSGPLRDTLDPLNKHSDVDLWRILEKVQMHTKVADMPEGLHTECGEHGKHFSTGQRQLLCLCKAFLRKDNIILIDEATANVDQSTDSLIQDTIKRSLGSRTVLTIAHRLNTTISYDKIMVLDKGKLIQFDHPHTLLQDKDGLFYQMVLSLGDEKMQQLLETAKNNFDNMHE